MTPLAFATPPLTTPPPNYLSDWRVLHARPRRHQARHVSVRGPRLGDPQRAQQGLHQPAAGHGAVGAAHGSAGAAAPVDDVRRRRARAGLPPARRARPAVHEPPVAQAAGAGARGRGCAGRQRRHRRVGAQLVRRLLPARAGGGGLAATAAAPAAAAAASCRAAPRPAATPTTQPPLHLGAGGTALECGAAVLGVRSCAAHRSRLRFRLALHSHGQLARQRLMGAGAALLLRVHSGR